MHRLVVLIIAFVVAASPAAARQDGEPSRRALAERLFEISQGPNLNKTVEASIREQMSALPKDMPADQRRWLSQQVPERALRMMDLILEDMVVVYATTFTVAELEAQIAFFETPIGRSIANKQGEIGLIAGQATVARQAEYMEDLMTDFCKAFECGQPAAK